jgi:hypothetical protein
MNKDWYRSAYRRNVVDMHITEVNGAFLSKFDAKAYVEMLRVAQVQSTVLYTHSHVGLCNFPSRVGPMHSGLHGRDILGETIDLCHRSGIAVVVYFSAIYDCWAYDHHPDWRITTADGQTPRDRIRRGICCPNSPYRDYMLAITEEICRSYDFEGMRFDMTFWPFVCYCPHCRTRYAAEVGGQMPEIVDWSNPTWVTFQRKREQWLTEFAANATALVKRLKADATVEHQAANYVYNWRRGVTVSMAEQNDFLQGDFYGDILQGSFVRKLYNNLSPKLPFGFETSITVELANHTAKKSEDLLRARAFSSIADGGAFIFIDGIDPAGTLNPTVYRRMGRVFNETKRYEPYLGGELCQDVGIYLSTESKFDPADNGKSVLDPSVAVSLPSSGLPHVDAAVNAYRSLIQNHIPAGVICRRNLGQLSRHKVIVLPNILMIDQDEAQAFRDYVAKGGTLYASKYTSLTTKDGVKHPDFLLADVFGVSYQGETREKFTFVAPVAGQQALFGDGSEEYPLGLRGTQVLVKARPGAQVLATVTLPYTNTGEAVSFASIHSDPPGIPTDSPAVVINRFGKGTAIYVAGDLELSDAYRDTFIGLLRRSEPVFTFEADAPKVVEVTAFDQPDKHRLIISLVNFQQELPNIPVDDVSVRIALGGRQPGQLLLLPDQQAWPYTKEDGKVCFTAPRLETFHMFALTYEK